MKAFLAYVLTTFLLASCSQLPVDKQQSGLPFDEARLFTTKIVIKNPYGKGSCSGVFISPAILMTAAHCAAENIEVDGKKSEIIKKDEEHDLMILYVGGNHPFAELASRSPYKDVSVVVVGYPMGVGPYVSEGRSQGVLAIPEAGAPGTFLMISAPVGPGNSGGPVFVKEDGKYKLVGIVSHGASIVYLAISLGDIKDFLKGV